MHPDIYPDSIFFFEIRALTLAVVCHNKKAGMDDEGRFSEQSRESSDTLNAVGVASLLM